MADKFENQQEGGQKADSFPIQVEERNVTNNEFRESNQIHRESKSKADVLAIRTFKDSKVITHKNLPMFVSAYEKSQTELCHNDHDESTKTCIIHPNNSTKGSWDLFITLVLLFTCITTPARMAFQQSPNEEGG